MKDSNKNNRPFSAPKYNTANRYNRNSQKNRPGMMFRSEGYTVNN